MWKNLLMIILLLCIATKNVFSLFCYVSDFESLKLGNVKNLNFSLQDCQNYNAQIQDLIPELKIEDQKIDCYTVQLSKDIYIKGCSNKNSCGFLINTLRPRVKKIENLKKVPKVGCSACDSNACNKALHGFWEHEEESLAELIEPRGKTSRKCYHCLNRCEISDAKELVCGMNIGSNYEAVCSLEVAKGTFEPDSGVRKCQVVKKGHEPFCPENSICTFCKNDLCNTDLEPSGSKEIICDLYC